MTFDNRLEQYQNGSEMMAHADDLADGWEIVEWPDGTAMLLSPGTCPEELGEGNMRESVDSARAYYLELMNQLR